MHGESQPSPKRDFVPMRMFIKPFSNISVKRATRSFEVPSISTFKNSVPLISEADTLTLSLRAISFKASKISQGITTREPVKIHIFISPEILRRKVSNIGTVPIV